MQYNVDILKVPLQLCIDIWFSKDSIRWKMNALISNYFCSVYSLVPEATVLKLIQIMNKGRLWICLYFLLSVSRSSDRQMVDFKLWNPTQQNPLETKDLHVFSKFKKKIYGKNLPLLTWGLHWIVSLLKFSNTFLSWIRK